MVVRVIGYRHGIPQRNDRVQTLRDGLVTVSMRAEQLACPICCILSHMGLLLYLKAINTTEGTT